jgi:type II secretory pathway pseudopilin PulG
VHVTATAASHARIRREDGFTLVEMLVASVTGMIVILAAFALIDASSGLSSKVNDRVDTTARARDGMEQITRELRSQVCLQPGSSAIVDGQTGSITFYTFTGKGTYAPEKHTITWSSATKTIVDYTYVGTGSAPAITYPSMPTRANTVVSQVDQAAGAPIFSYYTWSASGSVIPSLALVAPLSNSDLPNVVRIVVQYRVDPGGKTTSGQSTTLQDEVYAQTADPNQAGGPGLPKCG